MGGHRSTVGRLINNEQGPVLNFREDATYVANNFALNADSGAYAEKCDGYGACQPGWMITGGAQNAHLGGYRHRCLTAPQSEPTRLPPGDSGPGIRRHPTAARHLADK